MNNNISICYANSKEESTRHEIIIKYLKLKYGVNKNIRNKENFIKDYIKYGYNYVFYKYNIPGIKISRTSESLEFNGSIDSYVKPNGLSEDYKERKKRNTEFLKMLVSRYMDDIQEFNSIIENRYDNLTEEEKEEIISEMEDLFEKNK